MNKIRVNITAKVNSKTIRRLQHNGREHIVLPSYTLPSNVIMNGGLYMESEINKHYQGLEGTLAPLGHPVVNGQPVSAFSPEGINANHVGAWNRNVKKAGNRVYLEKWIDIEVAERTEAGKELLQRVAALEAGEDVPPVHTSVAVFAHSREPTPEQKAMGAEWVAEITRMDHDAILLHEVGAATPEQGVGLMVNVDTAEPTKTALQGESYRDKADRLASAAKTRFNVGEDGYVWIADFTDTQVIVGVDGETFLHEYQDSNGEITFSDNGAKVETKTSWIKTASEAVKRLFNKQEPPAKEEGAMALTPEEMADLTKNISESLAANMAEQLKPITERLEGLEANHNTLSETLTANARAEEKTKREAVAAQLGEVVANALTGEALDEAYAKVAQGAQLGINSADDEQPAGAPDPNAYFGGAQ